jgi:hypothetical protein
MNASADDTTPVDVTVVNGRTLIDLDANLNQVFYRPGATLSLPSSEAVRLRRLGFVVLTASVEEPAPPPAPEPEPEPEPDPEQQSRRNRPSIQSKEGPRVEVHKHAR